MSDRQHAIHYYCNNKQPNNKAFIFQDAQWLGENIYNSLEF